MPRPKKSPCLETPMLTVEQIAISLAVCPRTVRRMLAAGRIPHVRAGRSVRIDQADFDVFIQQQKENGRPAFGKSAGDPDLGSIQPPVIKKGDENEPGDLV